MRDRLKEKIAIVTGGSAGIGQATCELFAEEGAKVAIADIDDLQGEALAAEIRTKGGAAVFFHTDVSNEDQAQRLTEATVEHFGGVDILVNNAATFVLKGVDASVDEWQRSLAVNVIGPSLVTKYAVEAIKKRSMTGKGGAIVNLGSISSFIAQPNFLTYSATKAAMTQMSRNMAMDFAPFNIRVNTVCPGAIMTQATDRHRRQLGISLDDFKSQLGSKHLLNRVGHPREVAFAILFLASDEASFITGTYLMVDGGYTAQ